MCRQRSGAKCRLKIAIFLVAAVGLVESAGAAITPNFYEFAGKNLTISYSTSSLTGEPQLTYRSSLRDLVFRGDEIRIRRSEMGRQVTVTLVQKPDLKAVTVTILIPDIHLDGSAVAISTILIRTVHKTSIGGPELVQGQVDSYQVRELRGMASRLDQLQWNLSGEVTLSPVCGGPQRPRQNCEAPFAGAWVQVLDTTEHIAASAMTDAYGLFAVSVALGSYTVRVGSLETGQPLPPEGSLWVYPICPETPVVVREPGSTFVSIDCDTGIR
jgi:hypothetical protein